MLKVYAVRAADALAPAQFEHWMSLVTPQKRQRIRRFHFNEDARRSLIGDILIRWLACTQCNIRNDAIHTAANEYGKPYYIIPADFHFNISHSGDWVTAAVSDHPVGIDIEHIQPISLDIAARFFSPEECLAIHNTSAEKQMDLFYRIWTAKESYIKYIGQGLSLPLDSFSVICADAFRISNNPNAHLLTPDFQPGYRLTVCHEIQLEQPLFVQPISYSEISL